MALALFAKRKKPSGELPEVAAETERSFLIALSKLWKGIAIPLSPSHEM
jgi:hypothetical protein